jgi:hypothetical protein
VTLVGLGTAQTRERQTARERIRVRLHGVDGAPDEARRQGRLAGEVRRVGDLAEQRRAGAKTLAALRIGQFQRALVMAQRFAMGV